MDLTDLLKTLGEFVSALQNPNFLIFFCSLVIGYVIKNTQIPVPNWLIPTILAVLGLIAGAVLLGTGLPGRFQGALLGMTLSLASTGLHQIYSQIKEKFKPEPKS